jgi:hypothetical protein
MGTGAGTGAGCTARCNGVGQVPASEAASGPREAGLISFILLITQSRFDYHLIVVI